MIKYLKLKCKLKIQFKNDMSTMQFKKKAEKQTRKNVMGCTVTPKFKC